LEDLFGDQERVRGQVMEILIIYERHRRNGTAQGVREA